jgi:hypothetical protein
MGLPAPGTVGAALIERPTSNRKGSLSAPDAPLQARISRITKRLSHVASDKNSRSATALAWSFISAETRVLRVAVQRIGPIWPHR